MHEHHQEIIDDLSELTSLTSMMLHDIENAWSSESPTDLIENMESARDVAKSIVDQLATQIKKAELALNRD
jgi:hypothetical protein